MGNYQIYYFNYKQWEGKCYSYLISTKRMEGEKIIYDRTKIKVTICEPITNWNQLPQHLREDLSWIDLAIKKQKFKNSL